MTTSSPYKVVALVRHAAPVVDPSVPASSWDLGRESVESCTEMAEDLCTFLPASLTSSTEPKAEQTARVISELLELDMSASDGLREHKRSGDFLVKSEFESKVRAFFADTGSLVYGKESCDELGLRIQTEVEAALSRDSTENAILVTHGTAMTSYIMRHWQVDPFELWKSLELPAYLAFTVPTFDIVGTSGVNATLFNMTHPEPGS